MLESWHSALKVCEGLISELSETLISKYSGMTICERMKWVAWSRWNSKGQLEKLKNEIEIPRQLDEVYSSHESLKMIQKLNFAFGSYEKLRQ